MHIISCKRWMMIDEVIIAFFHNSNQEINNGTALIYNENVQTVRQLSTATVLVWTADIMCLQYNLGVLILQVNWVT